MEHAKALRQYIAAEAKAQRSQGAKKKLNKKRWWVLDWRIIAQMRGTLHIGAGGQAGFWGWSGQACPEVFY